MLLSERLVAAFLHCDLELFQTLFRPWLKMTFKFLWFPTMTVKTPFRCNSRGITHSRARFQMNLGSCFCSRPFTSTGYLILYTDNKVAIFIHKLLSAKCRPGHILSNGKYRLDWLGPSQHYLLPYPNAKLRGSGMSLNSLCPSVNLSGLNSLGSGKSFASCKHSL